jgi:glucosylceramidase
MKKTFLLTGALGLLLAWTAGVKGQTGTGKYEAGSKTVRVYTTADSTANRLALTGTLRFVDMPQPLETQPCIFVDPGHSFQSFLGIGGALTDASAETFAKLPANRQAELLQAYYNADKGIGYTLARTNINSCDFSSDSYTYVKEGDTQLSSFNIAHDEKYKMPFLKKAIAAAGGKLTLYASPWSPPAWMKDNNDMLHGGSLKPEYYNTWARYFVKFIGAYEKAGIPVWGVTVQNEPMAKQKWESCIFTATQERDFVKNSLGPVFQQAGLKNKKIIVWDHNRDLMYQRAATIYADPAASKYIWGMGFHWYEDWTKGGKIFENVKRVAESFPDKHLLFTEGCHERFDMSLINDWKYGENYGRSMIHDFNNGTDGWTDWNILLDEKGGPNHVGNFCFAPVHADTQTGELHYMNSYYYIGHFSKFIRPGARRISCAASRGQFLTTAFRNTDGTIAVVVMNDSKDKIPYSIWINGKAAQTESLPHSIMTLVF